MTQVQRGDVMIKDILVSGNGGWIGALTRLGLPVVMSMLLVGFLMVNVTKALADVSVVVEANHVKLVAAQTSMSLYAIEQARASRVSIALALQTCLIMAKGNGADTNACVAAANAK